MNFFQHTPPRGPSAKRLLEDIDAAMPAMKQAEADEAAKERLERYVLAFIQGGHSPHNALNYAQQAIKKVDDILS